MHQEHDLLDPEVILTILSETDKSEDKQRRKDSFDAYQIFSGNLDGYVRDSLSILRPKSYQSYTLSDISISGMITDKRAESYNESPIRTVENKSEELAEIYQEANAEEQLEFYDTIYNINRYALMWVNNVENKYQFMTLHPYEFVIVRDKDSGKLLIVGLNYPGVDITRGAKGDGVSDLIAESQGDSGANSDTWVFWSATQHVEIRVTSKMLDVNGLEELKKDIDYMDIPNNPNNVNPLGIIPFVFKSMDTSVDYPVTNPLASQTIKYNVQQSETLTSKNVHGSGIQVFSYPQKFAGKFDMITHGQMGAIELPQSDNPNDRETKFDYKTSGAQLLPMKDIDISYIEQVAKQHGLDNFEIDQGSVNAMNGISRAIAGASVQKVIVKNQKKFVKLEQEMFEIIKAWETFNGGARFNEEDSLSVVFPKPKVLISDTETLANIEKMLELGLIEEHEKYMKMDPNLSEEKAKEKLARVEAGRIARVKAFMPGEVDANNKKPVDENGKSKPKGII